MAKLKLTKYNFILTRIHKYQNKTFPKLKKSSIE